MIKDLTKVANRLDSLGLTKEADFLDNLILKFAEEEDEEDEEVFSLDKILSNPDDYDKVFLTELSSLYLHKEDRGCQRWKKASDHWRRQPVMERLFFLNKEMKEKLMQEKASQQYLTFDERPWIALDLDDYVIGSYPLELGLKGLGISYRVDGRKLNIKLNGPFHLGHSISEIIK